MNTPKGEAEERLAYTIPEVAKLFGISRRSIEKRIASGDLRRVHVGGRSMVLSEDLRAYVETLKGGASARV